MSLKITMREVCLPENAGSIGCNYVVESIRSAGYKVDYGSDEGCDIELLSVHHCSDFERVSKIKRTGKIRIIGGHALVANPRPLIPFSDVICFGEAESWIKKAIRIISEEDSIKGLKSLPGTILCSEWVNGENLPQLACEANVPKNSPYLNRSSKGHSATWYIEMSRGCPNKCSYCELGNSTPYRIQDTKWVIEQINKLDTSKSNRLTLFAPDEASHPGYGEILDSIHANGIVTSFGSMRIEKVVGKNLPIKPNMLIRVGMDGLTEESRIRVGRKQTDRDFINYFRYMSEKGHTNFKVFMIVGYPWETASDIDQWIKLMSSIGRIERKTNAHVRVKVTPLIPQPSTPLHGVKPKYDIAMIDRMQKWISAWRPKKKTGWFFKQDGSVMSFKNWKRQCELASGNEELLI